MIIIAMLIVQEPYFPRRCYTAPATCLSRSGAGDDHRRGGNAVTAEKDPADPQPVPGGADPVIVVPGPGDSREHEEADLDVEPFFDDLPVHPGGFHHDERQNRSGDELPCPLAPEGT